MHKVAFWYDRPQEYAGGLNYLRNLLFALAAGDAHDVRPYIFFGTRVDAHLIEGFSDVATVVRTRVLDRLSIAWFIHRLVFKLTGSPFVVALTIGRYGIRIVSHAEHIYARRKPFKVISWIPDFQYLHLPDLFPGLDSRRESERLREMVNCADAVILSSQSALSDLATIMPGDPLRKVTVLPFVSQPGGGVSPDSVAAAGETVRSRLDIAERFFFLPNQFWAHKNHLVAFKAVSILKRAGVQVQLVCSGNMKDYRASDPPHMRELMGFMATEGLAANIKVLGSIDYADVLALMRHCVCVINPSRFEGWSSSVEEAKSAGQRIILSDIPVHREQSPARAVYFDPDDAVALAAAMRNVWLERDDGPVPPPAARLADLDRRTRAYAKGYTDVVLQVAGANG